MKGNELLLLHNDGEIKKDEKQKENGGGQTSDVHVEVSQSLK